MLNNTSKEKTVDGNCVGFYSQERKEKKKTPNLITANFSSSADGC